MFPKVKLYYRLTKPGIIYSNVLAAVAGLLLASHGNVNPVLFIGVVIGIALVIGSACVINNYIDISIDKRMARTKNRPLVIGLISHKNALIYATILGVIGFIVLLLMTNFLVVVIGVIAMIFYVVLYGIAKRTSVHSTIVGSVSGALPPVAGYVAATNSIDIAAVLLFAIWVFWQMPHFYAIAMYRHKDYAAANLPVLPVIKGTKSAKYQIMIYIILFIIATLLMTIFGYTHIIYFVVIALIGFGWLVLGIRGWRTLNDSKWARQMFFYSLIVMLVLCGMLSVGSLIA